MARRYPQHRLSPEECGILDPRAGFLRTDRAVLSAVELARANGAQVVKDARVREIREVADGVRISTDTDSWTFDRVIVASGFGSGAVLPPFLQRHVHPKRLFLTWFTARDAKQFVPEAFPIFIRITGDRSLYGAPTVDGVTVKATLDGRGTPTADAATIARELTAAEVAESVDTVQAFLPGLVPEIVRSDAYPDLWTSDSTGLLGPLPGSDRIYCATGFSGAGFKMSSAFGAIAAAEALGRDPLVEGLDFLRPARFGSSRLNPDGPACTGDRRRSPASGQDLDDPAGVALDVVPHLPHRSGAGSPDSMADEDRLVLGEDVVRVLELAILQRQHHQVEPQLPISSA